MKSVRFPRRLSSVVVLMLALLAHAGSPHAMATAPESAALVVNADSWASMYIGNEYIHARQIPPWNVVYLSDLPSFESMSVEDFRKKILLPVLQTL